MLLEALAAGAGSGGTGREEVASCLNRKNSGMFLTSLETQRQSAQSGTGWLYADALSPPGR